MTEYRFVKKAYTVCALLLSLLLLAAGCSVSPSEPSSETEPKETALTIPEETESGNPSETAEPETSTETETESAEEKSSETPPETAAEPVDDSEVLRAYQQYYELISEDLNQREIPDSGSGITRTALCDICGNGLPELLYLKEGALHIVSSGEESVSEIFTRALPSETETENDWCFFTIAEDRRLYEYSTDPDNPQWKVWYYYEPFSDGSLQRTEILMQQQSEGDDPLFGGIFFYMGAECTAESGQEVVRSLLSGMENILLFSSERLEEAGFFSVSENAEDYGMSPEQTADFLRAEIRDLGGVDSFSEELMFFIEGEEYLKSGAAYYTGDGASEIRFGLYDLNGDETPELLITNGSAALSGRTAHVYEPENGSFRYLGDAGFRDCLFYTAPGTDYPGVFCTGGDSGFIMDIYYELQADGTIRSEMVASYEDTTYKIESHDEQRVTADDSLYEAWLNARPTEERPGSFVRMLSREELMEQGADALTDKTGEPES